MNFISDEVEARTYCNFKKQAIIKSNMKNNKHPIAILVNEETICFAESFAKMLKRYSSQSKIIGTRTTGASGVSSFFCLPGNIKIYFSGQYSTSKTSVITPNIIVKKTINGVRKIWMK